MASNNVEVDSSSTELKYLGFLKDIAVNFLVVLANVYGYAKENSGGLKSTIVFLEDVTVAAMGPIYEGIKDVPEEILVFVDEKIDKYTPTPIKNLIAQIQSLIQKMTPSLEKLATTAKTMLTPLVTAAVSLLQKAFTAAISLLKNLFASMKSLLQNLFTNIKPLLQNLLTLIESIPLIGKIPSLLQKGLAAIQSRFQESTSAIQSESKSAVDKAQSALEDTRETAGNILGNIPIIGDTAKTAITNPAELAGEVIDKTSSIVENTPVLGDVASKAEDFVKEAQLAGLKVAIKSAYDALKVVAIPTIAQFWYNANKNPLVHSLAGVILPVAEWSAKWYNHVVLYMDGKGYKLFAYLPLVPIDEIKTAYKVVKAAGDGLSAVGDLVGVDNGN